MSKEVADGENPLAPLVTSLQHRIQELEAENAKLLSQLSNCTISEDKKWRGLLCNLHEELLVEILSQLPPESLMQLKCTSKSWYAFIKNLIKDPRFVAKHLQNSISSSYVLFGTSTRSCCYKNYDAPKCSEIMFSLLNVSSNDDADDQIHFASKDLSSLRFPLNNYFNDYVARYHCNGVFCLADVCGYDAHTITLCNPAIREFKLLPKPSHVFRSQGVGFGYDSRANEYKVVVFGSDNLKHFRAEVYSLTTHSWREIVFGLDVDILIFNISSVYLKGVFYWFSSERNILCFDMCDEVFHSILMPGDCEFEPHKTRLSVWNESVAVIYSHRSGHNAMSFEIWVMDNCYDSSTKGSCSWCKVFTIGPLMEMFQALALRNDDELVIRSIEQVLYSYNIRNRKLREIDIFKVNYDVQFWSFSYVKSLVSVRGTT